MTSIIRKPLFGVLLITSIISCNNEEKKIPVNVLIADREKEWRIAIEKYPDSIPLRDSLIFFLEAQDKIDEAIAQTDSAISRDTTNADLLDTRARLYLSKNDTINAIHSFERAVQIAPSPGYLMSLGTLYAQTKNAKALIVAGMLETVDNGKAAKEGLFIKGLYFSYAGNYAGDKAKAVSFFDKCLAMDYMFMPAYLEKAIIFYDQQKYEEAIKILGKAVTLQNNFDEGYYWRGRCLEKLNKPSEAIEEYQTALMYTPDYTEAKEALARLRTK